METSEYCDIFLDCDDNDEAVLDFVAETLHGETGFQSVTTPVLKLHLVDNIDFDRERRLVGSDQYIFYRYYLEISPINPCRTRSSSKRLCVC